MVYKKLILGRYEEVRDGVPLKYRIETISPDLIDEVVEHMVKYFLTREPLTTYDRLLEDEESLNSYKKFWKKTLQVGESIVALEGANSDANNDAKKIMGVNITVVSEKNEKTEKYNGRIFNKVLKAVMDLTEQGDVFKTYNLDKYLTAYGLSVHPDYHGYNVGYRLLQCREPLCKALGIKATGTVFSSQTAQHVAEKAGYEIIAEGSYDNFKIDGEVAYSGLKGSLKLMGIKYD